MKPKITAIIPLGEKRSIEILETIKKQHEKINFIIEKGPNHCLNLNRGVKKAKTEILAFINLSPALYERFFCWILPCAEVIVELEVVK